MKKKTKKPVARRPQPESAASPSLPDWGENKHDPLSEELDQTINRTQHIPVVGIGASAGGLDAFKTLFEAMPADTGMAFVLIQHLDPTHESLMVDLLSRHTTMNVVQVEDRMQVIENHVYMIPPNRDLAIHNGELYLTAPAQRRGMRMPIDFFFRSLAEDQRERAICIILSGTGSDGTLGLKAIKSYGGMVMAQSPKTAQYDGMPVSAISTGTVDYVLPVKEMPEALSKYIQHSYVRGRFGMDGSSQEGGQDMNSVLAIMHAQLGYNFHHYKKNTMIRRIQRRMGLKQLEKMGDYVDFLRNNPSETKELFKDMLIGVTGFFRESESWQELDEKVIGPLVQSKKGDMPLRVWIPGCATGEEAYTLAILFLENFQKQNMNPEFQIFATDIDNDALERARVGRYPVSIASEISTSRLREYFVKEDEFFQVSSRLRDTIVFSEQNLISDPPFSKLDLISCRNLLIYLGAEIQSKIIELFHFALREGGHLLLGNSETIGQHQDIFQTVSKKWRIFQRIDSAQPRRVSFPILPSRQFERLDLHDDDLKKKVHLAELVNQALLEQFAPAAVLINRKHEILYHFGNTFNYLQHPTGETTNDLYTLCRDGLVTRMRGAVHKIVKEEQEVSVSGSRVKRDGRYIHVNFSAFPLKGYEGGKGLYLICFRDEEPRNGKQLDIGAAGRVEEEPLIKQLEYELTATKEDLQNTIEELETSNEELKASNEEVMSMNEELQSSNEELETSKEELQSLNEELNTVNSELQDKVLSLESTNNDLTNLINSTNIAAIFLDTRFHINFFSPASKHLFNLIATDIGRPLEDISQRFADPDLHHDCEAVLDHLRNSEKEIQSDEGDWYNRKIQPYRTQDNRIEGIVITFENITKLKEWQENLIRERDLSRLYCNLSEGMFIAIDRDGLISMANKKTCETLEYDEDDLLGENWFTKCLPKKHQSQFREVFNQLMAGKKETLSYFESEVLTRNGEKKGIAWRNIVATDQEGVFNGIIASGMEI